MLRKKSMIDGILHNLMKCFDTLRAYDKNVILRVQEEPDRFMVNLILKLGFHSDLYFNIFYKVLEEEVFIHNIQLYLEPESVASIANWFDKPKRKYPGSGLSQN